MQPIKSLLIVLVVSGCSQMDAQPTPKPIPNYCLLTEDVRFTQEQWNALLEFAPHIARYLLEQRETRLANNCTGEPT